MQAADNQRPGADDAPPPTIWAELRRPVLLMAALGMLLVLSWGPHNWQPWFKIIVANLLAFGFGAAVGAGELVTRYRDDPGTALRTRPARLYMAVNAAVGWAAFWLVHSQRIELPTEALKGHPLLNALILGGFGGMALFRTSFINLRVRDREVSIGPAEVLQIILRATDRAVDREGAGRRAKHVRQIMQGVTFKRASVTLPTYCYGLMQNLTQEERNDLDQWVVSMEKSSASDETKAYLLGLQLMNLVGYEVLNEAVEGLGDRIKGPPPDEPQVLGKAAGLVLADILPLRELCVALTPEGALRRAPLDAAALLQFPSGITEEKAMVVIALARLRNDFGPETAAQAIGSYRARRSGAEVHEDAADFGPVGGAATDAGV